MNGSTILIVEDETPIREMARFNLERAGFTILEAGDASSARCAITRHHPDLLIIDWMLPDQSGIELIRSLKHDYQTRAIPIIILTARSEEEDKVYGLDVGADDFVTKPFSPKELVARINAVLRRMLPEQGMEAITVLGLRLEPDAHRVLIDSELLEMLPTEFRLLHFFMTNPDRVFTRDHLLDRVWGNATHVEDRTVDVHIGRLRKALSRHGYDRFIQTVRGAGYRFSTKG